MAKTKESIAKYNKEYFARPEVIARAKERNAKPEHKERRRQYKKTQRGKEAEKRYKKNNWEKDAPLRRKKLLWRYGLTLEEYDVLNNKYDSRCHICLNKTEQKLHVDHCHTTKQVRGLLCGSCNRALGLFKDNTVYMNRAIEYLKNDI